MRIQEIIVFIIVVLCVVWVIYRRFIKKKSGCGCDSCAADCQLRGLMQQRRSNCCKIKKK
jgi:hypothetical protein